MKTLIYSDELIPYIAQVLGLEDYPITAIDLNLRTGEFPTVSIEMYGTKELKQVRFHKEPECCVHCQLDHSVLPDMKEGID